MKRYIPNSHFAYQIGSIQVWKICVNKFILTKGQALVIRIPEQRNYPLLLFSTGKKRKTFLRELARKGEVEYLRLAYELYPDEVMEVFSKMSKEFPTLEENIRFIVKDLGVERITQAITAEQEEAFLRSLLQHVRPQEIAQAIPAEQKKILLRTLVEQMSAKEVEAILRNDGKKNK